MPFAALRAPVDGALATPSFSQTQPVGWARVVWLCALFLGYVLAGAAAVNLSENGSLRGSLLWLPAGLALLGWLRLGRSAAVVLVPAAFAVWVQAPLPAAWALLLAVALTAATGFTVWLIGHLRGQALLDSLRGVLMFVLASAMGAALAAVSITLVLAANGLVAGSGEAWATWMPWTLAHWIGCLAVVPLGWLLTGSRPAFEVLNTRRTELMSTPWSTALALGLLLVSLMLAFGPTAVAEPGTRMLTYLPLPFALYAAVRGGVFGAACTTALVAVAAIWSTAAGHGPFAAAATSAVGATEPQLAVMWAFVLVVCLSVLLIHALQWERLRYEQELQGYGALLDAIRETQAAFIAGHHADNCCAGLLDRAMQLTGSRVGLIVQVREQSAFGVRLRLLAWRDHRPQPLPPVAPVADMEWDADPLTVAGEVVLSARVTSSQWMDGTARPLGPAPLDMAVTQHLALPLMSGTECLGAVVLAQASVDHDAQLPERLAPLASTCTALLMSERSQKAQALAAAQRVQDEARYRQMFDHNPNIMYVYDHENFSFLDVNPAALAHYGYTREEFLAMTLLDLRPTQDVPQFLANYGRDPPQPLVHDQARHQCKDGSLIEVEVVVSWLDMNERRTRLVVVRDVTSQRAAQRALRESQARLDVAVHGVGDGLWDWDLDTDTLTLSDACETMLGYQPGEIQRSQHGWDTITHPDDLHLVQASVQAALNGRSELLGAEFRVQAKDGQWRWIQERGKVVEVDAHGRPRRIVGTQSDIHARKLMELGLRESEQRLELALAGGGHLMWEWNVDTDELLYQGGRDMFSVHQFSGLRTQAELDAAIHPHDLPENKAAWRAHAQGDLPYYRHEYRVRGQQPGQWVWMAERGQITQRHEDGRPARMVGTVSDITALREATAEREALLEQLREVANHVPGVIYEMVAGADGLLRITYISDRLEALVGVAPARAMADVREAFRHVVPEDLDDLREGIRRMAHGDAVWRAEFRVRVGEQTRWIRGTATPQQRSDGSLHWHGYLQDVTDEQRLQQALKARAAAEAASDAKTAFLSRMSHELRTPLNAMLGFAQLLELDRKDPLSAEQQRRVGHIRGAGQHLLDMIVELLDLTRIEAGQLRCRRDPVPLHELAREVTALLEPEAGQAQVSVALSLAPDLVDTIESDGTRLRQVITNLLSNAVKYNRPGGQAQLSLLSADDEQGRAGVLITVEDDGLGMTPAQLDRLFEPFNRLGRESTGIGGTGIGLALTKALVGLLGGQIRASSKPGRGTRFMVWLPVQQDCELADG